MAEGTHDFAVKSRLLLVSRPMKLWVLLLVSAASILIFPQDSTNKLVLPVVTIAK